jgi:uncharacterized protein involved in response to NO
MINVSKLSDEQNLIPILRLGFRPFFLMGALFAFLAMAIWILSLNNTISVKPLNDVLWWHSHEMLFGFVPAIIAGFLLTAVQTWTGVPSVKGNRLLFLVLVWTLARIFILFPAGLPPWWIIALDLAFLPLVGVFLAIPLIKVNQTRNMVFLPILCLMSLANLLTYLPQLGFDSAFNAQGLYGMTMLTTALVALLGGRVIPMFTANGTNTTKVLPKAWLEITSMASLFIIFIFFAAGLTRFSSLMAAVCALSACLHFYRCLRWRPWVTLTTPLVWSLHFTMMFIPIGLGLMAAHFWFAPFNLSVAIHSLTVGTIGGMNLAMMSRVSLGHSGRPLKAHPVMSMAFIFIICAALARSIGVAFLPQNMVQLWGLSGILWCAAFACFVIIYFRILSRARVDGKPG